MTPWTSEPTKSLICVYNVWKPASFSNKQIIYIIGLISWRSISSARITIPGICCSSILVWILSGKWAFMADNVCYNSQPHLFFLVYGQNERLIKQADPCQSKSGVVADVQYCDRYWECGPDDSKELYDCPNGLVWVGKNRGIADGCDYPWRNPSLCNNKDLASKFNLIITVNSK